MAKTWEPQHNGDSTREDTTLLLDWVLIADGGQQPAPNSQIHPPGDSTLHNSQNTK